jgi:hypothetical protein
MILLLAPLRLRASVAVNLACLGSVVVSPRCLRFVS